MAQLHGYQHEGSRRHEGQGQPDARGQIGKGGDHSARRPAREFAIRLLVVAALGVDAYVHFDLADEMQLAAPGRIGGGTLFVIQAGAAIAAAVLLLLTGSRLAYVLAALVALSALVPVLLYTYVNLPALGPVPSLYDPTWYTAKVVSVVAEAAAVVLAVVGIAWAGRRRPAYLR